MILLLAPAVRPQSHGARLGAGARRLIALLAVLSFSIAARGDIDARADAASTAVAERAGLQVSPPVRVTGASPYPASCGTTPYPDSEVEFSLAADRARPERLVGAWIQNARGGAPAVAYSRDGGASWNVVVPPGLAACTGSDYIRSTDPWLSVGPGGVAYLVTLPVVATAAPAIQVSRSDDMGATWSFPVFVERRTNEPDDKPTLAADPYRAGSVYVSWSRLRLGSTPTGPTFSSSVEFSRSRDGARTWSVPTTIDTPPAGWTDVIAQMLVPAPGELLCVFSRRELAANLLPLPGGRVEFYAAHSDDGGSRWSAPTLIGDGRNLSLQDTETSTPIRSGDTNVFNAAAGTNGRAYVAWTNVSSGDASQLTIIGTRDGGRSWSHPHRLRKPSDRPMNPDLAVADNGTVALRFYDLREDQPGDAALSTRSWLRVSRNGHGFGREVPLGGVFDLRTAPVATGFTPGRTLGEYQGLVGLQADFGVLFAQARPQAQIGATDGFFTPVELSPHRAPGKAR